MGKLTNTNQLKRGNVIYYSFPACISTNRLTYIRCRKWVAKKRVGWSFFHCPEKEDVSPEKEEDGSAAKSSRASVLYVCLIFIVFFPHYVCLFPYKKSLTVDATTIRNSSSHQSIKQASNRSSIKMNAMIATAAAIATICVAGIMAQVLYKNDKSSYIRILKWSFFRRTPLTSHTNLLTKPIAYSTPLLTSASPARAGNTDTMLMLPTHARWIQCWFITHYKAYTV